MRGFTIFLVALSTFVVEIAGNNDALPYELLYYYRVYKMQYESGVQKTLATGCSHAGGAGMCYFDEFVRHIMDPDTFSPYQPKPADHTSTPNENNLGQVKQALHQSARYDMSRLLPNTQLPGEAFVRMQRLNEVILQSANEALNSGSALASDASEAQAAIAKAMQARGPQAADATHTWAAEVFIEDELENLSIKPKGIDWDESLTNVDNDDNLDEEEKTTLKQKFDQASRDFGRVWPANTVLQEHDKNHLSILRFFQNSVKEIGDALNRWDGESNHVPVIPDSASSGPSSSSSSCSSDYESDSSEGSGSSGSSKRENVGRNPVDQKGSFLLLADRQLTPIIVSTIVGSTSSHSSSVSKPPSTTTTLLSVPTPTTNQPTKTGFDMAVTTQFAAPTDCGGVTEVATMSGDLWQNILDPAAGATLTSCLPSQFAASVLAGSTTSLPPFQKLVCPSEWESNNINSTYVICCPSGFSLRAPNRDSVDRPGLKAICTSDIWPNVLIDVTSYDENGHTTVIPRTVGEDGDIVFAKAFEGFTTVPVISASTTSSFSMTTTSSSLATRTSTSIPTFTTSSSTSSKSSSSTTASTTSRITSSTTSSTITTMKTTTSVAPTSLPVSSLPACGQTCWNNMLAQFKALGCTSADPACLCRNVNFGYGLRDCANGACGSAVAPTVVAFGSSTCSMATASKTTLPATPTATGIASLPSCGQTCMNNMIGQYSALGCSKPDPACLCRNANFGYGIRDCSNGACGSAVASTVISFGSSYCASATAAPKS